MAYENNEKRQESVYSKRIRAGKRRTYFFDVRATRGNDYYITITESRKKFNEDGYDRHKIFLYKEDFNKFIKALGEAVEYVKTDLMPDFDFDAYNHDQDENGEHPYEGNRELETRQVENQGTDLKSDDDVPEVALATATGTSPIVPDTQSDNKSSLDEEVDKW